MRYTVLLFIRAPSYVSLVFVATWSGLDWTELCAVLATRPYCNRLISWLTTLMQWCTFALRSKWRLHYRHTRLVVLVKLSLLAKWLARKTPLRKPNRGEGIVSGKPRPKSAQDFLHQHPNLTLTLTLTKDIITGAGAVIDHTGYGEHRACSGPQMPAIVKNLKRLRFHWRRLVSL